MQSAADVHIEHLPHALLDGLEDPFPTLIVGPSGIGKTHVLHALSSLLRERGIPHVYVDAAASDAVERFENAPERAVTLLDNYELAPYDVLHAAAAHLLNGAPAVGAATESHFDSGYGTRLSRLYEQVPELKDTLGRARMVRLQPASDEHIARVLHRVSPDRLDAVTVDAILQLAWGRLGWALDLLQLHRSGSLATVPRPRIRRPYAGDLHLPSLHRPTRIAEAELEAADIAAAVTLSEIGPRSHSGVFDLLGSQTQERLAATGFLLPVPHAPELLGVPELYAAAVQKLTDPEQLASVRRRTAHHLLAQESFGIPLADREAVFCSRILARSDGGFSDTPPDEHHARFQHRIIGDLVSFGQGEQARDLLLRLGPGGPGISRLTRARLTTVVRDARTGLQALIAAAPPRGNTDLPTPDPRVRFATLLLRARLAAEAGIPLDPDPDIAPDDEQWNDAQLVARRWNDARPLDGDSATLLRIARTHAIPEVALLAEQLLSLEAAVFGLRYRAFTGSPVEQRIARLAISASEEQRDALECAAVAQSVIRFLATDYAQNDLQLQNLVDHLPGASRHRIWATHFHAARTALICGDIGRALSEWQSAAQRMPRFLPWRLHTLLHSLGEMPGDGPVPAPNSLHGYSGQTVAYFSGRLDLVGPEAFADPVELADRIRGMLGVDLGQLEEISERIPIRAHLEALHAQNPLALMRAADALEACGFWAPATYAMQEARRIFLRRRAAGSVTATDARIAALQEATARRVPWFEAGVLPNAPRERLTPRESETAQLAAEGLSNRQIAERLRCSVRTVESHLSQARAKLGVSSREELGARLMAATAPAFPSAPQAPLQRSGSSSQHAR